ncbi:MAG: type II toxin-antitoxin system RelE/ParE family toxin [Bacteroidales bacterium]
MAARVVWSKIALADKLLILDYWFKKLGTKSYPKKLEREFRESIKHLSKHPSLGKRLENTEVRYIVKDYYLIFYKVYANEVRILHLWDSRRNPDDLIIEH